MEERLLIVSSDGHAGAEIDDFQDYIDPAYRTGLTEYARIYKEVGGGRSTDVEPMANKVTDIELEVWKRDFLENGRLDGYSDPARRTTELDREGIAAEVLFPDFGIPFAPFPPSISTRVGGWTASVDQLVAGARAYNRWLVDFCAKAPDRLIGQSVLNFQDVPAAVADLHWTRENGFASAVFAMAPGDKDLYDPEYEPIWSAAEDLDLPITFHVAISTGLPSYTGRTEKFAAFRIAGTEIMESAHRVLTFLILGGVLERHPKLKIVFTEQHSDWVIGHLARMDHSYHLGRSEIREWCTVLPSEYFARQCYLGASIFSRGEIRARERIGVDKMMLGMDYPHHEGTLWLGTREYLRATLGAEQVPETEARQLLAENAIRVFGLDRSRFTATGSRVGPTYAEIMAPVQTQDLPGDITRPLLTAG